MFSHLSNLWRNVYIYNTPLFHTIIDTEAAKVWLVVISPRLVFLFFFFYCSYPIVISIHTFLFACCIWHIFSWYSVPLCVYRRDRDEWMNMWWTNFSLLFFLLHFSFVYWSMNELQRWTLEQWKRANRFHRRRCVVCSQDQHKSILGCTVKANWRSAHAREEERERMREYTLVSFDGWPPLLLFSVCLAPTFSNTTRRPLHCCSKWIRRSTTANSACLCHTYSKNRLDIKEKKVIYTFTVCII